MDLKNKEHIAFFNSLLKKTEAAYIKSDVYKDHGKKDWGYSITATSFEKKRPLWDLIGELIKACMREVKLMVRKQNIRWLISLVYLKS